MIIMGDPRNKGGAVGAPLKKEKDSGDGSELHVISGELIHAVHSHDVAGVADCLKAAFEMCDGGMPEEDEHIEE